MIDVDTEQVKEAIHGFLQAQLQKKLEPEEKILAKLDPLKDVEKFSQKQQDIAGLKAKYELDAWMKDAAERMAGQLKFGTHISKGVHPDSKGDNLNFKAESPLPDGIVGSQVLKEIPLDANGNAAALPLASFFETWVDEGKGVKIRHLIQEKHASLTGVFASSEEVSEIYGKAFEASLDGNLNSPVTHERNKQILWPKGKAIRQDNYLALVPLYPSGLTNFFFSLLNGTRYSDENKQAKENRNKKNEENLTYVSIPDIGVTRLGGTKPQNISLLTSKQSGRNYLLPSFPPVNQYAFRFSIGESQKSFFNWRLGFFCRDGLEQLFGVVEETRNIVDTRENRKRALDLILQDILLLAEHIQSSKDPGWSLGCQLDTNEKYWLDPSRAELEDQEAFAEGRLKTDWPKEICKTFSQWLNERLQRKFPEYKTEVGDPEFHEWAREMEEAIKESQRSGRGVFV